MYNENVYYYKLLNNILIIIIIIAISLYVCPLTFSHWGHIYFYNINLIAGGREIKVTMRRHQRSTCRRMNDEIQMSCCGHNRIKKSKSL